MGQVSPHFSLRECQEKFVNVHRNLSRFPSVSAEQMALGLLSVSLEMCLTENSYEANLSELSAVHLLR